MKRLLYAICLGLVLVSCRRDTPNDSAVSRSQSNPASKAVLPSRSSNETTNPGSVKIVTNDAIKIEFLARVVQTNRAANAVRPGDKAMQEFTAHWRPIAKRAKELENLLGKPDERTEEYLGYRFDTGRSGWNWVFQLSGETITNFYRIGIN